MPHIINKNDPKIKTVSEIAATIKENTGDGSLIDTRHTGVKTSPIVRILQKEIIYITRVQTFIVLKTV